MNLADAASPPSESPTNSAALSPSQRREIEIWFAQALDLSSDRRREYAKADELFRKCLERDGGNVLVVTAYLENLARWRGRTPKATWRGWWNRRAFTNKKSGSAQERYAEAIAVLSKEVEIAVLKDLASGACKLGWELAEEAYLREILLRDSGALQAHARLSEICVSRADFQCAEGHLKASCPDQSLSDVVECLDSIREPAAAIAQAVPDNARKNAIEDARAYIAANQFTAADKLLSREQAAFGNSLAIREARENLQIAQLRFQFDALERLEKSNPLAAQARVHLHQKLMRLQLDTAGARSDRYPEDWRLRLELAQQLIRVGNYFEALRRLKEPPLAPQGVFSVRALRLQAETQQRLKRFDAAMELYRELLSAPAFAELPLEEQDKVRAQADRLMAAMNAAHHE